METINPAGRHRPVERMNGKPTPVPWLMGNYDRDHMQWARMYSPRTIEAEVDHLCIVCGEHVDRADQVYGLVGGSIKSDHRTDPFERLFGVSEGLPTPTWGHPRCILTAALHCPHLKAEKYVAEIHGVRVTADQLAKYVRGSLDVAPRMN